MRGGVVKTFCWPQTAGALMDYAGPIDLNALVDLDSLAASGVCPWTFLAFPSCTLNGLGIPSDPDAQRYIAAIQSAGVRVGIWRNSPSIGSAYAAVTQDVIGQLQSTIENLNQFPESFAADLSERLFAENPPHSDEASRPRSDPNQLQG